MALDLDDHSEHSPTRIRSSRLSHRLWPAAALILLMSVPAFGQSNETIEGMAAGIIEKRDLQRDMPHHADTDEHWNWGPIHIPREVAWILAAGLVLLLLYSLRNIAWTRDSEDDDGWMRAQSGWQNQPKALETGLAAADALAAGGKFVDAMHVLLLHGLAEMRLRLETEFADSLTSREILRRASLPDRGRTALQGIVAEVERTYFGARPAGRADYDSCRAKFAELADSLRNAIRK